MLTPPTVQRIDRPHCVGDVAMGKNKSAVYLYSTVAVAKGAMPFPAIANDEAAPKDAVNDMLAL